MRGDRVRPQRRAASRAPTPREFDPATPHAVIDLLPEQKNVTDMGATMRLGAQPCYIVPGHARRTLPTARRSSRNGIGTAGRSTPPTTRPSGRRAWSSRASPRTAGWPRSSSCADHPFFIAGQFHPELRSRPTRPHPLFRDFVGAAQVYRRARRRSASVAVSGRADAGAAGRSRIVRGPFVRVDVEDWPGLRRERSSGTPTRPACSRSLPDGEVLLVKQFRPAVRQVLTEIPAGAARCGRRGRAHVRGPRAVRGDGVPARHDRVPRRATTPPPGSPTSTCTCSSARRGARPAARPRRASSSSRMPFDRMVAGARGAAGPRREDRARAAAGGRAPPPP